jgi:A1 cistron-splicing factor AAR2
MQEEAQEEVPEREGHAAADGSRQQHQKSDAQLESNLGAGTLFFSPLPRCRRTKGATPSETTLLHVDRSEQLEQMLAKEYSSDEMGILGELQIAYIAFILGQNYDGFEQWRALLLLLCSCEGAVAQRPGLFAELCRVFFAQLSQAPGDLFGDDLTKENFMGSCALSLLEVCDAEGLPPKLRKRCGKLRELVQQKFGISVEDLALLGEDAPLIVDVEGRDLVDLGNPDLHDMD